MSAVANAIEEPVAGRLEVPSDQALTPSERTLLSVRRTHLTDALRAADCEAVKKRVAKLFGMMAVPGEDDATITGLVDDYAKLLSAQPLWAIDAACMSVLRSGATFRPSAPDMLRHATRAADPHRAELATIQRALQAVTYNRATPEERARVSKMFAELAAKLSPEQPRSMTAEQHGLAADRAAAAFVKEQPKASEALLGVLGYPRSHPDETAASEAPTAGKDGF